MALDSCIHGLNNARNIDYQTNKFCTGQVEVDMLVPVYNFSVSILIHRGVIEELNGVIRQLGEQKILSMVESKEFRSQ